MFSLETSERPRERLAERGVEALALPELLALVIGTGTARRNALDLASDLLAALGDASALTRADVATLVNAVPGLGPAKAARVLAAIELGRRVADAPRPTRPIIVSPADAARVVMRELAHAQEERLVLLILDRRSRLIRRVTLYKGTADGLMIRPAEVLAPVIEARAPAFMLAHNHPSGDPTPSPADRSTTRRLQRAAAVVGLELREHLVIGGTRWTAICARERGVIDR